MVDISSFLTDGAQVPTGSAVIAKQSQTVLPEWYTNYAMQILANQNAAATQPYQAFQGPRVAEFSPAQQQGFEMTGQAATAYQPALSSAVQKTQQVIGAPGALDVAQPYLSQAGQSTVSNIGQYMNPYTDAVVNRIAELGQRNLSENLLPAINSKYIQAGQLGYGPRAGSVAPSGMMTDTARAIRDTSADILGQQTAALQQGYTQAAGLSAADLARQGQLGSTAGQLATSQATTGLNAAQQMGALGASAQQLGLTGAGALTGVGTTQQAQAQKNIDAALSDWAAQKGYSQEQINNMLNTLKGVAPAAPATTTEAGIQPANTAQQYAPSTAATVAGALATGADLLQKFGVI